MTRFVMAMCLFLIAGAACAQSNRYVQTYGSTRGATQKYSAPTQSIKMQKSRSGQGYDFDEVIKSGAYARKFSVHVPPTYDRTKPMPVVMVFHGMGLSGKIMKYITLFDGVADRNGFIVVYPDGINNRWNDGLQRAGADDVQFTSDMLGRLSQVVAIDGRRVYACGISNGGYFVQRLAGEMGNRIAAIGVVASTGVQTVLTRNSSRTPVMFFMGTADPLLPQEGQAKQLGKLGELVGLGDLGSLTPEIAQLGGLMTTTQVIDHWVRQNGASSSPRSQQLPDRSNDGCRVRKDVYGNDSVIVYTIENGGHTWPGGFPFGAKDLIGNTTQDISASQLMWDFFRSR